MFVCIWKRLAPRAQHRPFGIFAEINSQKSLFCTSDFIVYVHEWRRKLLLTIRQLFCPMAYFFIRFDIAFAITRPPVVDNFIFCHQIPYFRDTWSLQFTPPHILVLPYTSGYFHIFPNICKHISTSSLPLRIFGSFESGAFVCIPLEFRSLRKL